jgi:hypothetical protein
MNHKSEVLKIYPNAHLVIAYNKNCDYLAVGAYICRYRRLFGFDFPFFPIKIAHGWTEPTAWENAFNTISIFIKLPPVPNG